MRLRRPQGGAGGAVIDLKQLWPGDVLLTTSDAVTSAFIRRATRSPYSHAVLHIGQGLVFESTPKGGIGFSVIDPFKAEGDPLVFEYQVFGRLTGATLAHVYRHKDIVALNPNGEVQAALQRAIHAQTLHHWGRDYSKLRQLGPTTRILSRVPRVRDWILDRAGELGADDGKLAPGAFCSQLIVEVLAAAGWDPLIKGRPQGTSPRDLADVGKSKLVRHPAAEVGPDALKPCDESQLKTWQAFASMHRVAVALNHHNRDNVRSAVLLGELQRKSEEATAQLKAAIADALQRGRK